MSESLHLKRLFVKKLKILYSSDHPISIKFLQLVVNIVIKELQRKIKCEKLMFR